MGKLGVTGGEGDAWGRVRAEKGKIVDSVGQVEGQSGQWLFTSDYLPVKLFPKFNNLFSHTGAYQTILQYVLHPMCICLLCQLVYPRPEALWQSLICISPALSTISSTQAISIELHELNSQQYKHPDPFPSSSPDSERRGTWLVAAIFLWKSYFFGAELWRVKVISGCSDLLRPEIAPD